jgi:hypothetical protein
VNWCNAPYKDFTVSPIDWERPIRAFVRPPNPSGAIKGLAGVFSGDGVIAFSRCYEFLTPKYPAPHTSSVDISPLEAPLVLDRGKVPSPQDGSKTVARVRSDAHPMRTEGAKTRKSFRHNPRPSDSLSDSEGKSPSPRGTSSGGSSLSSQPGPLGVPSHPFSRGGVRGCRGRGKPSPIGSGEVIRGFPTPVLGLYFFQKGVCHG